MSGVYVDVALPLALPTPLTYAVPDELAALAVPGARVVVPVQQREMVGIVTAAGREAPKAAARQVIAAPDGAPLLDATLLALAGWTQSHYAAPPGLVLRAMLPAPLFSVGKPVVHVDPAALPASGAGPALARLAHGERGIPLALVRRAAGTAGVRLVQRLVAEGRAQLVTLPPRTAPPERLPTNNVPLAPCASERAFGTEASTSMRKPGGSRIRSRGGF